MQDPEQVRRFTRAVAMMKDPPLLPMAAWFAVVPMLVQSSVIARPWGAFWLVVAVLASALASRWFKRTYGVVSPSPDDAYWRLTGARSALGLVVVKALGLTMLTAALRLPVELGLAAVGAWVAWGARASEGVRPHLYVLAAICIGLAFLPLITDLTAQRPLQNSIRASIFSVAFGAGWAYVCIQDYRVIRRSLRDAQS
jgi:hypothetical protein